jgi:hypothetical protein
MIGVPSGKTISAKKRCGRLKKMALICGFGKGMKILSLFI